MTGSSAHRARMRKTVQEGRVNRQTSYPFSYPSHSIIAHLDSIIDST